MYLFLPFLPRLPFLSPRHDLKPHVFTWKSGGGGGAFLIQSRPHLFFAVTCHLVSLHYSIEEQSGKLKWGHYTLVPSLTPASFPVRLTNCLCSCQHLLEQMPSYFDGLLLASVSWAAGHKCSHTHEDTWARTHTQTQTYPHCGDCEACVFNLLVV